MTTAVQSAPSKPAAGTAVCAIRTVLTHVLADRRVVRPVYFPRTNGHMEWAAPDGSLHSATFDDALSATRAIFWGGFNLAPVPC